MWNFLTKINKAENIFSNRRRDSSTGCKSTNQAMSVDVNQQKKKEMSAMQDSLNKVTLIREIISNKAILGKLYYDGKEVAKTLENPWLENHNEVSCIPEGSYECKRDNIGKFRYWRVELVPGRQNIEIHNGNTEKDTAGCIIIGKNWAFMKDQLAVDNSKRTLSMLLKLLPDDFILEIKRKI